MYVLKCDEFQCKRCGTCERLIRGFRTKYDGYVFVSRTRYHGDAEVSSACRSLMTACPNEAIDLSSIP